MIKKLFPIILIAFACSQMTSNQELPILGNVIYEGNDTIYHTIKPFELYDQDSAIITNEIMSSKVYVADFFFTSCPTICPTMKSQMLRVYKKFEGNAEVGFLSHTIDPEYDTIPLLKDYSSRLDVNTDQWKFLWGEMEVVYDLAETSYMSIANEDNDAPGGFIHSGAFLLVDKEGRLRGFYDGTVEEQVDVMMNDIEILLKEYQP